jgi:hypothetical protein
MDAIRPPIDFGFYPEWRWPAWTLGMDLEDLFTTLHQQYNTGTIPLQDFQAFHHDVNELSRKAKTPEEFHRLMAERSEFRRKELLKSFESVAQQLAGQPSLLETPASYEHATALFGTQSLDSLVRYFASFMELNAGKNERRLKRPADEARRAEPDDQAQRLPTPSSPVDICSPASKRSNEQPPTPQRGPLQKHVSKKRPRSARAGDSGIRKRNTKTAKGRRDTGSAQGSVTAEIWAKSLTLERLQMRTIQWTTQVKCMAASTTFYRTMADLDTLRRHSTSFNGSYPRN